MTVDGKTELFDTHCHIQSIGLKQGERTTRELWAKQSGLTADAVVAGAVQEGVTGMICVGCDLEDSQLAVDFVQKYENCWASVGLHPHEAKHYAGKFDKLEAFSGLVTQTKVVAIGECGLDYYYNHSSASAQKEILHYQLELAFKHDLPVIFHVREAFDDFWEIFDNYQDIRGVLHSFTDTADNLFKAQERGLYIGVNGIATFTKDNKQLEALKTLSQDRLLLETDAPFLTPEPFRGSINEPKRLGAVADFMSRLRGEDRQELAKATSINARKLFGI